MICLLPPGFPEQGSSVLFASQALVGLPKSGRLGVESVNDTACFGVWMDFAFNCMLHAPTRPALIIHGVGVSLVLAQMECQG